MTDDDRGLAEANRGSAALTVLLIDSDSQHRDQCSRLIAEDGHTVWGAADLITAANFVAEQAPDVIIAETTLLDGDGADPLDDLRLQAPNARAILMAAGPPDATFLALSKRHPIYGYHDKNHGSASLRLWLKAAQESADCSATIAGTRRRLQLALESVSDLHKIQSLEEALEAILESALRLTGGREAFVAARMSDPVGKPPIEGFGEFVQTIDDYVVGATTADNYSEGHTVDKLEAVPTRILTRAVEERHQVIEEGHRVLPLILAEHILGLAYVEQPNAKNDSEVLHLFGSQAAAAIRNAALFELATVDATTRVFQKAFTLDRLRETLKLAWRKAFPVSVLMIDIDKFKELNDSYGHITGDRALRHLGKLLKDHVRDSDIVGRFGGDEFLIILIDANHDGADIVAERLYEALASERRRPELSPVPPLKTSLGMATLDPGDVPPMEVGLPDFGRVIDALVHEADSSMYAARRKARGMFAGRTLSWADFVDPSRG